MVKEHLIKVNWICTDVENVKNDWFEIYYWEARDEIFYISFEGLTQLSSELVKESGWDFFNDADYKRICEYILSINDTSKKTLSEMLYFKQQNRGEFFVVVHIDGFKTNYPEDPEEWDVKTKFLGILGEDVKFSY